MMKFYLVWEPTSGYTKYRHECIDEARREACRLAGANREKEFFVLEAVSVSKIDLPVVTTTLDDLPF